MTKEKRVFNKISGRLEQQNWTFSARRRDNFLPSLWQQGPDFFQRDIRTFPAVFVATKPDIFSQILGQFSAIFLAAKPDVFPWYPDISCHVGGNKTRYFQPDIGAVSCHLCSNNPDFFFINTLGISSYVCSNKTRSFPNSNQLALEPKPNLNKAQVETYNIRFQVAVVCSNRMTTLFCWLGCGT